LSRVDRYLVLLTRWLRILWRGTVDGAGWRRGALAARRCGGESRRFTGVTRKCVPGLGFECLLHWEIAGTPGNPSRGSGGGGSGWRRRPAARGGSGRRRAIGEHEKAGKRGITSWRHSLPHDRASTAACGGKEAVGQRGRRRPKREGGGSGEASSA
jgi:hypothetical protein